MVLHIRAKVLCNVWSYDFYDMMDVVHWITATPYDKSIYVKTMFLL